MTQETDRPGRSVRPVIPVPPSISSRTMSMWPACRAVSSIMWTSTQRNETVRPFHVVPTSSSVSSVTVRSAAVRARP